MNIGESNAWFNVLRALQTDADLATIGRGYKAAQHLTERANATLGAGPRPDQVEALLDQLTGLIVEHEDTGGVIELPGRRIETTPAREGLL